MASLERATLISAGVEFIERIRTIRGVSRIALVVSILTEKTNPKDIDFVLTVSSDADYRLIATIGSKLKGGVQARNLGADIFLATPEHNYIGRTCSHRQCHYRAGCDGFDCRPNSWIKTDLHIISLDHALIAKPPLTIWPTLESNVALPNDIEEMVRAFRNTERAAESAP